jgi:hypothetical protein
MIITTERSVQAPTSDTLPPLLHTGGVIITDDPTDPGSFIISNRGGSFALLSPKHTPDFPDFMRRHSKAHRRLGTKLPRHEYSQGRVTQECPQCGWKSVGARSEFSACQVCGTDLATADCEITFDGLVLKTWKKGFVFIDELCKAEDPEVRVWHGDVKEVIECITASCSCAEKVMRAVPIADPPSGNSKSEAQKKPSWAPLVTVIRWVAFAPVGILGGVCAGIVAMLILGEPHNSLMARIWGEAVAGHVAVSAGSYIAPGRRKAIPAITVATLMFMLYGVSVSLNVRHREWLQLLKCLVGAIVVAGTAVHKIKSTRAMSVERSDDCASSATGGSGVREVDFETGSTGL